MKLVQNWNNEAELRQVFTWLTRIGAGVRFGSRPIGWYQSHQVAAIEVLEGKLKELGANPDTELRNKLGMVQAKIGQKWVSLMSAEDVFNKADNKARS